MGVDIAKFRADMPEFGSTADFPNAQVQNYLTLAAQFVGDRWGDSSDYGVELHAAHHLALAARRRREAVNGGIPGQASGPVASKSVDKASVSYDTGSAAEEGAGFWNQTSYGQEFFHLVRMFGAGPVQVGTIVQVPNSGAAWPGPYVIPAPTSFG